MPYGRNGKGEQEQRHYAGHYPDPTMAREIRYLDDYTLRARADARHPYARDAASGRSALQICQNLVGILVAVVRIPFQAAHDDFDQPVREVRA